MKAGSLRHGMLASLSVSPASRSTLFAFAPRAVFTRAHALVTTTPAAQFALVFLAYVIAGKLGQATGNLRSGNIGPVWPAYGVALAGVLAFGNRVWPAVTASAFLVAFQSPVYVLAALGQAAGATVAVVCGATALRRVPGFTPTLARLRDALAFVGYGAFGSALISSSLGIAALYFGGATGYSGLGSAWLIYWLGDATGALLVTPLAFALPAIFSRRSVRAEAEYAALLMLLLALCTVIFYVDPFGVFEARLLTFAVLPFVMWAAINFGLAGAASTVFLIATIATVSTAIGAGPFGDEPPFIGAVRLDLLYGVLALTGLTLSASIAEREAMQNEHEQSIRTQVELETRLHLAAIMESSSKRAEEALSNLSQRLIDAQEQERRRIARELHDDISQRLATLAMQLQGSPELQQMAGAIAADVQTLSHQLHSSRLELLGITVAMRQFCAEFAALQRSTVTFDSRDVPRRLPPETTLCLFRILQESLHNAAKHSGVRQCDVRLWGAPGQLHLSVSDRGKGFDARLARLGRGIGLISMEERLKLVGGQLSVVSQPHGGTTIHARVPIAS